MFTITTNKTLTSNETPFGEIFSASVTAVCNAGHSIDFEVGDFYTAAYAWKALDNQMANGCYHCDLIAELNDDLDEPVENALSLVAQDTEDLVTALHGLGLDLTPMQVHTVTVLLENATTATIRQVIQGVKALAL